MDNNIIYLSVPRKDNRINCTSDDLYNDLYEFWMNTDSIYRNFSGFIDDDINGIFITHEHSDHVKGVGVLSRKYDIPIYANADTWSAMESSIGKIKVLNLTGTRKFRRNSESSMATLFKRIRAPR